MLAFSALKLRNWSNMCDCALACEGCQLVKLRTEFSEMLAVTSISQNPILALVLRVLLRYANGSTMPGWKRR